MIRKTIIAVLTLAAVGTVVFWIAGHFDDVRLETEAFDVAYQRLANARVATGEMKTNRPADLLVLLGRLATTEEPITEFQTLGWEDRLASPIAGTHLFSRDGRVVFENGVGRMSEAVFESFKANGVTSDDVDMLIPHQANLRMLEAIIEKVGAPEGKVFVNVEKYGNMASACLPIALDETRKQGKVNSGDLVLLVAFGSGFVWASALMRM